MPAYARPIVGSIAAGLILVPLVLEVAFSDFRIGQFYKALVGAAPDSLLAWLIVLSPYLLLQLGRSIGWSLRVVQRDGDWR